MRSYFSPKDENEEHEKAEKDGDVVHGSEHNHQLSPQVGQEADQLEYSEEAEGPEHRDPSPFGLDAVHQAVVDLEAAQHHDQAVKHVEPVANVPEDTVGSHLKQALVTILNLVGTLHSFSLSRQADKHLKLARQGPCR